MPKRYEFANEEEFKRALLNWFAGLALQGFLSAPDMDMKKVEDFGKGNRDAGMAWISFQIAKSMLIESEKTEWHQTEPQNAQPRG